MLLLSFGDTGEDLIQGTELSNYRCLFRGLQREGKRLSGHPSPSYESALHFFHARVPEHTDTKEIVKGSSNHRNRKSTTESTERRQRIINSATAWRRLSQRHRAHREIETIKRRVLRASVRETLFVRAIAPPHEDVSHRGTEHTGGGKETKITPCPSIRYSISHWSVLVNSVVCCLAAV